MNWHIEHWKGFTAASNGASRESDKGDAWLSGWDRYTEQAATNRAPVVPSDAWVLV